MASLELDKLINKLTDTAKKLLKNSNEHDNLNDLSAVSISLIIRAYKQGCIDSMEEEKDNEKKG